MDADKATENAFAAKLRILYSSNAPWAASGYGIQGRSLLPRLAQQPQIGTRDNIAVFAWYGLQGGIHHVDGFRIYPVGLDGYGNDIIEAHTRDFQANIVVSLIDVWVMHDTARKIAPALWLPWMPIDHDPVPDKVLESLQGAHLPLTYSRWGHDLLTKAGVENHYIPHGVETGVYRINDDADTLANFRRDVYGDPDHLTVMVAANKGFPDRKAFQVQLRAWAKFAEDKPGAKLYIHTEPTQMYGGLDMAKICQALGIGQRVIFPDRYQYFKGMPQEYMALMYNAADIFLGASMSEGFGIPIIEAQACGTPVIVTDFSAMPELVRWGYKIPAADVFWTPLNSWQAWPDVHGITEALEELYAEWHENGNTWPIEQREAASKAIHDEYSWDTIVANDWSVLLERLVDDVEAVQERLSGKKKIWSIPQIKQPKANTDGWHKLPVTRVDV